MRPLYTITNSISQVRYAGNDVTVSFPVAFQFFEASTLRVRTLIGVEASERILGVEYLVSGGEGETGVVTFTIPPPTGTTVIIDLDMPFTQETVDLAPNGPLPAEDLEQGLDRVVTTVKQLHQEVQTTPELDATFDPSTDPRPTLPPPVAGQMLVGKADETGWINVEVPTSTPTLAALLAPGVILAIAEDGRVYQSPQCGSSSFREIESCYAIGTEIGVKFKRPHNFTTGQSVYCRAQGRDMRSYRAHPVNNWSPSGTLRHPTTGVVSAISTAYDWGGAPWANIERIDAYNIRLPGSVFKTDPSDPDPEFNNGYAYTEIVTKAPQYLQEAFDWLGGGNGTVMAGPGWYGYLVGEQGTRVPSNVRFMGAGRNLTHLVAGDFFNQQIISIIGQDIEFTDCRLWGNRQFYGQGIHVARIGSEDPNEPIKNVAIRRVDNFNSSGYGWNNGKITNKIGLIFEDVRTECPNNDLLDAKNKGNGNKNNWLIRWYGGTPGLGNVGTNRGMVKYTLAANPITTVADGRTTVQVRLTVKARINNRVWISPCTSRGVSLDGWYAIIGATDYVATIETGQAASSSGTGGGTGIQTQHFRRELGSTGCDLRGYGWIGLGINIYGDLDQQIGVRTRGGGETNPNGFGAHFSTLDDILVTDECPSNKSFMQGLILQSDNVIASNIVIRGRGGNNQDASVALTIGAESSRAQIKNATVYGTATAYACSGSQSKVDFDAYACGRGAYVTAGLIGNRGDLDGSTPFEVSSTGVDPIIIVKHAIAHGFSGGEAVTYDGALVDATINVDMNDAFTVLSILDTLRYTVEATGQTAAAGGTFGGPDVSFTEAPAEHNATSNQIEARLFACYERPFYLTNKATSTKIVNSHAENSALDPLDESNSTIWGPSNTGELPNTQRVITIDPAATSYDFNVEDSGSKVRYEGTNNVTLNLPPPARVTARGFWIELNYRSSGGTGFAVKTPDGLIRCGTEVTTGGGAFTSSTQGAEASISWLDVDRWSLVKKTGTWTAT